VTLANLLGVRMVLLIGPTVPLPAPVDLTLNLSRVEVTMTSDGHDGFQMTFQLSKTQPLDYDLVLSGLLDPFSRVVIGVVVGATPEVLIDGVITHHQVSPATQPGASTLTVTGSDVSLMLDLEERNAVYRNQPDSLIVATLLLSYAQCGLLPPHTVIPTTDVPIELQRIPRQQETDLRFIQRLAARNGYVFYVEPLTFGITNAYWGPENRLGLPQPALVVGQGPFSNIDRIDFANDALAPVGASGSFLEPISKTAIPIPSLPPLRVPPLALSPTPARRKLRLRQSANLDPAQAAISALASATNAPEPVQGQGTVETVRYGSVMRARRLVGVRGAGLGYDGAYMVSRVTHSIQPGRYDQQFTIHREGTGSLLPVVP
jgi:hypothetical protein